MIVPNIDAIEREIFYRKYESESITGVLADKYFFKNERISIIPKMRPIFECEKSLLEYYLVEGGRGSGKSESIAQFLVLISREESTRILCTREIQNSIKDSVKKIIEEWIKFLGFQDEFHITESSIIHKRTKTDFIFMGLKAGTDADSMKSLKGAKYVWIEEAQTLSKDSWMKLDPTIRVDGRKIFFSYNPKSEQDTVNDIKNKAKSTLIRVNYNDNPFLPKVLLDQALELKETDPELYVHVWEGVPMAEDSTSIILPYSNLLKCVDLHKDFGFGDGMRFGGFDIADGVSDRHDKNSLAVRAGSTVHYIEEWRIDQVYKSVQKINQAYYEQGFAELCFDATGIGVAAKSEFARIESETGRAIPYDVIPFQGASKPMGADMIFVRHGSNKITNAQYFKNLKAQSWWNLKLRLDNSIKLLSGHKIDRDGYFLSFSSEIKDLNVIFSELSQATYKIGSDGKVQVDKCPGVSTIKVDGKNKEKKSPNIADSIVYSFSKDVKNGLRAHGEDNERKDNNIDYTKMLNTGFGW